MGCCSEYLAPYILEYRHYRKRYDIWKQALEIIKFREWYPSSASRVRGIDACSQEIGCRPEVFAPVFRLLGCHSASEFKDGVEIPLPKLGKTYHVGEDFLDLVDGLRAIQEAIYFLNLDCGDRLGHAIALGIDVDNWYAGKQNRIALPVQDLLDNLAWFCHALQHYKVPDSDLLRRELNKEFEYWFRIVYLNYMQDEDMQVIMQSAEQEYQNDETKRNYHKHLCHFGIDTYYQAYSPSCVNIQLFLLISCLYQYLSVEHSPSFVSILSPMTMVMAMVFATSCLCSGSTGAFFFTRSGNLRAKAACHRLL